MKGKMSNGKPLLQYGHLAANPFRFRLHQRPGRRRLMRAIIHRKSDERHDLDSEFKPYLPGLLEWSAGNALRPSDGVGTEYL